MKKIFFSLIALAAAFTSCDKGDDGKAIALTMYVEGAPEDGRGSYDATCKCRSFSMAVPNTFGKPSTLQAIPFVMPQSAAAQAFEFESLNPELFTVDNGGLITAVAAGTGKVEVRTTDGSNLKTRYQIVVGSQVFATGITVLAEARAFDLKYGGKTYDLGAKVSASPGTTWNTALKFTSNDTSIATVDANTGIVTSRLTEPAGDEVTTITIESLGGAPGEPNPTTTVTVTVKARVAVYTDLDRTGWKASTITEIAYPYTDENGSSYMYEGAADKQSTGWPAHMFDGNTGSFLSLVKPNVSNYNGANGGTTAPSFVVDMTASKKFNYIKWNHRNGTYANTVTGATASNSTASGMRVIGVLLYGSDSNADDAVWTAILPETSYAPEGNTMSENVVWIPNSVVYNVANQNLADPNTYNILVKESTYRYIKVELAVYRGNNNANSTYDTTKYQHVDYPGIAAGGNSCLQVAEFGAGHMVIE